MADSNSCALVIRLRKEKRVVALPKVKFVDKNLSFQEVFTDVYDGDLDVRVKCRVGFKKPGDAEPKDFVSVDLSENVGAIVNALSANFIDIDVLDEEPQAVKPLNAFDVLIESREHKDTSAGNKSRGASKSYAVGGTASSAACKNPIPWCKFSSCRGEIFRCVSILECWFFLF